MFYEQLTLSEANDIDRIFRSTSRFVVDEEKEAVSRLIVAARDDGSSVDRASQLNTPIVGATPQQRGAAC
jgi:hypothetical protein